MNRQERIELADMQDDLLDLRDDLDAVLARLKRLLAAGKTNGSWAPGDEDRS